MATENDHERFAALDVNHKTANCSQNVLAKRDFYCLEGQFGFRKMLEYLADSESAALVYGNPESCGCENCQELR